MKIKSLEIQNFRQYKGTNKIIFSTDPQKNVTVIKGENGAGKTTLLEAFKWCLYGGSLNLPNYDKLVTADIDNNLNIGDSVEVLVEINFEHNKNEYYVTRRHEFVKSVNRTLKLNNKDCKLQRKKINGALEVIPEKELEKIVPSDLSRYFFFDGERIENISKFNREGKKDLNQAIRNILGLNVVLNTKEHLKKVIKSFENDFSNDADGELKALRENKEDLERALIEKKQNQIDCKEELDIIDKELEDISLKLKNFEEIKVYEKEREEKIKRIKGNDELILSIENQIKNINKRSLPDFLAEKVLGICKEKLDLSSLQSKGIVGIDSVAIDELLKRGKCICGQKLELGSCYIEELIKQKDFQPPASLGTIINKFNEQTIKVIDDANDYNNEIRDKLIYLEEIKHKNELLNDDLEILSNKLIGIERAKELEIERKDLLSDKEINNQKLTRINIEIDNLESDIKKAEGNIEALALKDKKNDIISLRKNYAKKLLDEVEKFYSKRERAIKTELNKRVKEIFSQLLCTNHQIEISDDYKFKVYDIDGEEATSQGQDVITSFAFIGGIIDLAKQNHKEIEVDEPYPLIMDAPFAKLSKVHRRNIAKLLPNIAEQFILITVDSQYEGDIEETIKSKIGNEYELVMHTNGTKYTEIVERR